jgi:hypothetical protein
MLGTLVFLTPLGALVILAVAIPLVGLALAVRRERRAREVLRLPSPAAVRRLPRVAALAALLAVLGLAATQPALRSRSTVQVRTDAQAFFVLDISRSMLASRTATSPTRLGRAKRLALAIRAAVPQVPAGIATLTDRVLPDLFPTADASTFAETVAQAVAVEHPPPTATSVVATSLGAIGALGTQNFFLPSARHRLAIVLTDGESEPFDAGTVARDLAAAPEVRLVIVHVGFADERVYENGRPDEGYHGQPGSVASLESLAATARGTTYGEDSRSAAIRAVRGALGSGPTVVEGRTERTRTIAPYVALLALVPLALLFGRPGSGLGFALRSFGGPQLERVVARARSLRGRVARGLRA